MAHKFEGPKDRTNPLAYWPIAVVAVLFVAWIFASGYQRGAYIGVTTEKSPEATALLQKPVKSYNVRALAQDASSEVIAEGRQLYDLNCASCHGKEGLGDGTQGKGLNPPPRNFHAPSSQWKNGSSILGRWVTLEKGIQGSSMASYASMLDARERMAIVHYMERWLIDAPETTPDMLAELPAGTSSSGGGELVAPADPGPRIPIDYAMAALASTAAASPAEPAAVSPEAPGADLYAANCASCHGDGGQGADAVGVLTSYPYVRTTGPALVGAKNAWVGDEAAFSAVLSSPRPGGAATHGFGHLTREDMRKLHRFTAALASQGD